MATSTEIKQRANTLADKTDVNSITPKEVGGIMYDLASHGENVLRNGGTLGIRKVYESVAAMEADSTNPKDFWGDPIKKGNLVVIYDGTTTGVDNNKIYAFMKPGWELATKLDAAYATKAETDAKLAELGSKVYPILNFIGNDDEQVVKLYTNLNPGYKYKLRIHNPNVEINNIISDKFRLSVSTCNENEERISPIIQVALTKELSPIYDFEMPQDGTTSIIIGIRCKKGIVFPISIEDITSQYSIKENETDAIGLLNLSQIKRGYKITTNDLETVDELFFITPYISTNYGDEIEVYLGLIDSSVRFSSYDADKNYISSYTQNADPRIVKFASTDVKYLRCSFKIENIGSYIKINGTKVFELTKNLYDTINQYSKFDKVQEGPLYKSYIICSGRTVTNADIINNILPRHIYKIYLTDINPPSEGYSDPEMYKFSIRSYNQDGSVHTTLLTVLGKDEWKSSYIIETPSDASYLYLRARCEEGYKFQYYIEDITSSNEGNTNGIINANPIEEFLPKFQSAKKRYYTSSDTTKKEPVVVAHISDIHANLSNVERFLEFTNYWKDYIDILVNTGDTARNGLNDGVDGYNAIGNVGNIINVVGNHDTASYVDGVFDWQAYVGKDCYDALISPNVIKWGVVQPNNASQNGYCYFYKDFVDNNLRIVFVDIMAYDEAEDVWVANVLNDARNKNYDVLIATHFAGAKQDKSAAFERVPSNYTTLYELGSENNSNQLYGYNSKSYLLTNTVQQYIDNGGIFCGYIQGHYHADFIAKVVEYPKQLIYSIGSSKEGEVRDYNHIIDTRNQDEFQIISIDTYLKTIKLYKVGANVDLYGRHKNSICVNYVTGEIIAESF